MSHLGNFLFSGRMEILPEDEHLRMAGSVHSQHSLRQCGDLEERVMVDKDTGLWIHFRKERFLFFPLLFVYYLVIYWRHHYKRSLSKPSL